jgi:hypothetical protein
MRIRNLQFIIIILYSFVSFSQNYKYKLDEMIGHYNDDNNKYLAIANELLNSKYGKIDNETRFYCEYFLGYELILKDEFKLALDKYKSLLKFCELNTIDDTYGNLRKFIKDIKSRIKSLDAIVANLPVENNPAPEINNTVTENPKNNVISETIKGDDKNKDISNNNNKTVTLTVSGTGKTIEEAKTNALRSAIEQAFGAFISSKTEILNDNLIKDEIVSVTNGNIQKFDIISQVEIQNNGYALTLNATVSIDKLTSYAQSKGVSVEIKGGLFAANIIQQELNEKAELISLQNILNTSNELLKKSFDYSIETKGNPTLNNGNYDIPLKVTVKLNKNFYQFRKYFINSISGLTMSDSEILNYEEIKKPIGQLVIRKDTINFQEKVKIYTKSILNYQTIPICKVDIENFNEKQDKLVYYEKGNVIEITKLRELKKRFENVSNAYDIPIYKISNSDLGYSKIFFRNLKSLNSLNIFFDNLKKLIFNFQITNDLEKIDNNKIIKLINGNLILDNFKILLCEENGKIIYPKYLLSSLYRVDQIDVNFSNILSIFPYNSTYETIISSFSKFKEGDVITTIYFTDTKSLEEIKQLSEYKIKPKE